MPKYEHTFALFPRLKETLAKALASSDNTAGRPALNTDSPADMAIRLMDSLILEDEVCAQGRAGQGRQSCGR